LLFDPPEKKKKKEKPKLSPLETAARILMQRPLSRAALKKKLHDREISWKEAEATAQECERLGFLNDAETAQNQVRSMRNGGDGSRKIRMKLRIHGFKKEDVEHAFEKDNEESGRTELDVAKEMLRRKMKTLAREPDKLKRRMKALRALAGKGFPPDVSYKALDAVFGSDFEFNLEE